LGQLLSVGFALKGEFLDHPNFGPLLRFDAIFEQTRSRLTGDDTDIKTFGLEVVAARFVSFRIAQYDDPSGDIVSPTVGVGLSLDWDSLPVALRADYASRPQATGLQRVDVFSVQLMKAFD
jgi:hypothetical protein